MLSIGAKVIKGTSLYKGIRLNSKGHIVVKVREGVHTDPRTGESMSMTELASIQHFGADGVPARPFLEDSVREQWAEISKAIKSSMILRFKGLSAEVQYEFAANDVTYLVRSFLRDGDYYRNTVPNTPKTIETKGNDTPLLDSGQLIESIEAVYVKSE